MVFDRPRVYFSLIYIYIFTIVTSFSYMGWLFWLIDGILVLLWLIDGILVLLFGFCSLVLSVRFLFLIKV